MGLKIDRYQLELDIKPNKSQQELQALNVQLTEANKKLTQLGKERDKINASIKKENAQDAGSRDYNKIALLEDRLEEVNKEYEQQITVVKKARAAMDSQLETIGITGMTLRQLTDRQRDLNFAVRNLTPNSANYNKYKAQLDEVNERIKTLKGTAVETKGSLQGLAEGFNKYAAMSATAAAVLAEMGISGSKSVQDFADMKEAESQVVKYTNLTKAGVEDLNEEFKKMDTRVSRKQLNQLAGDAGKLGIDGKKNILDFVDAGIQIKASLGEDLGQDAIKNIGKLANMFGDDQKLGLKKAMLSSGSAINQLGQDSSATEAYILDFTYRLAGAGKQANMLQTEIMGLGSVLDQNGQEVETSATAIGQLLTKMYQDPAKFAKLAGIDLKEFIRLLNRDGNDALIKFSTAMNDKGGFLGLAPMFEKMNLDGTRSVGVLSTIAKNVDQVRAAQKDAADAYTAASSVTKEYNKQNSTVQAGLDKAKKKFLEVSISLGERLEPAMRESITLGAYIVKGTMAIMDVISEHKTIIIAATLAYIAFNAQKVIDIASSKLQVFWNSKIVLGLKAMYTTMMENPYVAVMIAIAALVDMYQNLAKAHEEVSQSQQDLNDINSDAEVKANTEKANLEALIKTARDEKLSKDERRKAIKELNDISPEYLGTLTLETINTKEADIAVQNYTESILLNAKAQALRSKIEELEKRKAQQKDSFLNGDYQSYLDPFITGLNSVANYISKIGNTANTLLQKGSTGGWFEKTSIEKEGYALNTLQEQWNRYQIETKATALEENNLRGELDKTTKELIKRKTEVGKSGKTTAQQEAEAIKAALDAAAAAEKSEKDKKDAKAEAARNKAIAKAEKAEKVGYDRNIAELKSSLSKGEMTQEEYHDKAYQEEIAHIARILKIKKDHGANSTSIEETNNKLIDAMTNEANYQKEKKEKDLNNEIAMLDDAHNADLISLAKDRLDGTIATEEEYQRKMKESDMDYYQQKKTIQEKYGKDSQDIDKQINDILLQNQKEAEDKKKTEDEKAKEERKNAAQKAFDDENNIEKKSLINQSMYDNGLIEYEDYQKNKTKITELEAQNRTDIENAALQTFSNMASSASQLYQSMQSKETSKVESKYSKLIKAAQKAGKDTTKLEEQEEAEKLAIKKKYADKEFQMTVLSVVAKTAEAIMDITAHWAHNPIVEGILIAGAVAEGAVQLAVAKNTRDEAAGLYEGGYSDGYTDKGNSRDVAGVIPVHKNEFVANHKAVGNPAVRQFLDVFDASQKDGTISMMNTTDILDKVRITGGKYDGGYTGGGNTGSTNTQSVNIGSDGIDVTNKELLECLIQIMGYTKATAEKDTVTIRDIKKKIQHIDTLEKNASR